MTFQKIRMVRDSNGCLAEANHCNEGFCVSCWTHCRVICVWRPSFGGPWEANALAAVLKKSREIFPAASKNQHSLLDSDEVSA